MEEASTAMRVAVVLWQRSPITQCQNLSNCISCSSSMIYSSTQLRFDVIQTFMSVNLAKNNL